MEAEYTAMETARAFQTLASSWTEACAIEASQLETALERKYGDEVWPRDDVKRLAKLVGMRDAYYRIAQVAEETCNGFVGLTPKNPIVTKGAF
jgi:hypothetical protein